MTDQTPRHYAQGYAPPGLAVRTVDGTQPADPDRLFRKEYRTSGDAIRAAKEGGNAGWRIWANTVVQRDDGCDVRLLWRSFEFDGQGNLVMGKEGL